MFLFYILIKCNEGKNLMKLITFIMIFVLSGLGSISAQNQKSQDVLVNVSTAKTLNDLFKEIEKQTGYHFVYSKEDVNKDAKLSSNVKNGKLSNVLKDALTPLGLSFYFSENYISISSGRSATGNNQQSISGTSQSLPIDVSGTIVDELNEPIIGASVAEDGTTNGTLTDMDGNFSLKVASDSKLRVTYVGYTPQTIPVNGKNSFHIILVEDQKILDEVVVVGYGVQKKATLTGAVASINGDELAKVSQPSLKASMLGKVSGIRFQQTNGEPGNDGGTFDIRGYGDPLTIIDGVERPFSQIDPNEIESVTVLKDASASVYGFKGANGVIIVKTKQGAGGKPRINYSYNIGLQAPVKNLEMMDAYEYAYYRNEALMNTGQPAKYSDEELEKYRTGSDPINYPTTDWYDATVRSVATKQQHNLNISGGSEQIKYFFSFGYLTQDGILKSSQSYDRYNFRSNITTKITDKLTAEVGLGGRLEDRKYPYYLGDEGIKVFTAIKSNAPNVPIYANNNNKYYFNSDNNELNPVAMLDRDATGHKDKRNMEFNSQIALSYQITKGLTAKAFAAFDYTEERRDELKKEFSQYTYDQANDKYNSLTRVAVGELLKTSHPYYKTTQQYSLNYLNTFNSVHNVSGLFLFEWKEVNDDELSGKRLYSLTTAIPELNQGDIDGQEATGNSKEEKYGGFVGRFNYDYLGKYLAEFSFRYDGSSKTSPDHRWGFFPAVSGGWRLSEEPFIKEAIPFMDNFKIRGSWGKVGDDSGLGASQFISGWLFPRGSYIFGGSGSSAIITPGIQEANLANRDIFWYKVQTTNIGFDASFWNNKLSLEFDYFYRKTTGKYAKRELSLPSTAGFPLPQENLNSDDNRGFELVVGTNQKINDFQFQIKGNVSYSRAKDLYMEQGYALNKYLYYKDANKTGYPYRYKNITWGYEAIGQFQSYDEIYNSPVQDGKANSSLRPGDIKYQDINTDGVIDEKDEKIIGKGAFPDINFGLSLNGTWRNFDFDILFQGACNYTQMVNAYKNPFRGPGEGNGFKMWTDRWHKADYNDPNSEWIPGKFPSLRTATNDNNSRNSTFWATDAYYIRLKSIEIGYTIPKSILSKVGVQNVRVYVNAYNPLTITNVKYTDPEAVEGWMSFYYPQLKVYSFGINIGI